MSPRASIADQRVDASPESPADRDPDVPGDDTLTLDDQSRERARRLSQAAPQPPASVPGHRILRQIGEGAYGSVWLAREQNTGKQVAIKFYSHRRGVDWSLLNREVEKLAVLYTARSIVGLLEVGWDNDPPYYVMEYLENGSLAALLQSGPLPANEAVRIATSVLQALIHAHGAGILHCDLKPANVLLDADYEPRICDFGQSRLSDEQKPSLGTLFYMPPDQATPKAIPDVRWDVYAVGALLYHMLVGRAPFRTQDVEQKIRDTETLEDRLHAYCEGLRAAPPPTEHRGRPGVDRALADIVDRCLALDPADRFPNAQAVLDALRDRERRRNRRPLIALGILAPALLLLAMTPIMGDAMRTAVRSAEQNLTQRALESDTLSAAILARSLERELQDRLAELERHSRDEQLREAIVAAHRNGWQDRSEVQRMLDERKEAVDALRRKQDRRLDTSWFLTDDRGLQQWRRPFSENTDLANFAWRDYFHGRGYEMEPQTTPAGSTEPIDEPHLSQAFRSNATGHFMVAWSVPVRDEAGNVVAVLARTTHLSELLADYPFPGMGNGRDRTELVVALVDGRDGKFLNHPWMTTRAFEGLTPDQREELALPPEFLNRLDFHRTPLTDSEDEEHEVVPLDDYRDLFARFEPERYDGPWLAAFSPVGHTGWIAVIQERAERALAPVQDMRRQMAWYAVAAVTVACTLIGVVWYLVTGALTDRRTASLRSHARNPDSGG